VGRFVLEIDGDRPVFVGLASSVAHGHPQVRWSMQLVTKDEGDAAQFQEDRDGVWVLPRNPMESEKAQCLQEDLGGDGCWLSGPWCRRGVFRVWRMTCPTLRRKVRPPRCGGCASRRDVALLDPLQNIRE